MTTTTDLMRSQTSGSRIRPEEAEPRSVQPPGPSLMTALRRYWDFVLLVTVLVFALSTSLGYVMRGSAYAEASVALTAPGSQNVLAPGASSDSALARYTSQRALFTESDEVLEVAAARAENMTVDRLRRAVTVTPSEDSTSMVVQVSASTPEHAVALVDLVVDAYALGTAKQVSDRTNAALTAIDAQITKLNTVLATNSTEAATQAAAATTSDLFREAAAQQTDSAVFNDGIDFVQAATVESATPVGVPVRAMALGLLVGLALAAGLAWLRADRDRRLSDARAAEDLLGAPLLGELPALGRSVRWPEASTDITRSCRDFVGPYLAAGSRGVLLVTSAETGAGCSTTALGVAAAGAAEGLNVLVIDADPRTHGLSSLLGLPDQLPGLAEASADPHDDPNRFTRRVLVGRDLKVSALPAGGTSDEDAITAVGLQAVLTRLRPDYDLIVADAPAAGGDYLASTLSGMADAVVVAVRRDSRATHLADLQRVFALNRAKVLGYVYTFSRSASRVRVP